MGKKLQAANNLKKMKRNFCFLSFHGKEIVGIVEVIKAAFPDKSDKRIFVSVQVGSTTFKKPILLK